MLTWHPTHGETVHLRPGNRWALPAGRYRLGEWRSGRLPGTATGTWSLHALTGPMAPSLHIPALHLILAEQATVLTPIGADQLAREAQELTLRLAAPLRGANQHRRRGPMLAQHDCSDLALFRAACEPRLI